MLDEFQAKARNDVVTVLLFMLTVNIVTYQLTWVYAGPITAVSSIILVSLLMHRRSIKWRDFGLAKPRRILILLGQTAIVFVGTGLALYVSRQIAGLYFEEQETTVSRFGDMEGNLPLYLWWVLMGWVVGGFCEEMLFRGFILNRFESMIGQHPVSTSFAILFQAAIFGCIHFYYQGAYGALTIFAAAAFMGLCYVFFDRNLWPLILSHGVLNTLGFLGDYLGDKAF